MTRTNQISTVILVDIWHLLSADSLSALFFQNELGVLNGGLLYFKVVVVVYVPCKLRSTRFKILLHAK
jgi:hypothetical protein